MSLRDRLKAETRGEHKRLEARLDLLRTDFDRSDLIRLLELFHGYYLPCEQQIYHLPQTVQSWLADRLKVPLLAADLKYFGHTDKSLATLPRCQVTAVRTVEDALGRWYVLEGSTLGGQVVAAHLETTLGLAGTGLAFFRSYRSRVVAMWQEYCRLLDEYSSTTSQEAIIEAAKQTFLTLERWLVERELERE